VADPIKFRTNNHVKMGKSVGTGLYVHMYVSWGAANQSYQLVKYKCGQGFIEWVQESGQYSTRLSTKGGRASAADSGRLDWA
jgi:hypothetical protein